jgi:hypothetical protein
VKSADIGLYDFYVLLFFQVSTHSIAAVLLDLAADGHVSVSRCTVTRTVYRLCTIVPLTACRFHSEILVSIIFSVKVAYVYVYCIGRFSLPVLVKDTQRCVSRLCFRRHVRHKIIISLFDPLD